MCGIAGFFPVRQSADSGALEVVCQIMGQMRRRGPDAEGVSTSDCVTLGHRRLAVIDPNARANQPMVTPDGRYNIVFSGEIYNFQTLQDDLMSTGRHFSTTSDTEVILALFAAEGAAMLPKLRGMFAFVIWDSLTRRGFAALDPYGIKPLYVATVAGGVLLASQVKALLATGLVSREPDPRGQAGFWLLGSVPEPHTWYRSIKAIPAGHSAWIEGGRIAEPICWSDIGSAWREAPAALLPDDAVRGKVRAALRESVARHLVADVPIGVFLSGSGEAPAERHYRPPEDRIRDFGWALVGDGISCKHDETGQPGMGEALARAL